MDELVDEVRVDLADQVSEQPEAPAPAPAEPVVPAVARYAWDPTLPS